MKIKRYVAQLGTFVEFELTSQEICQAARESDLTDIRKTAEQKLNDFRTITGANLAGLCFNLGQKSEEQLDEKDKEKIISDIVAEHDNIMETKSKIFDEDEVWHIAITNTLDKRFRNVYVSFLTNAYSISSSLAWKIETFLFRSKTIPSRDEVITYIKSENITFDELLKTVVFVLAGKGE